MARTKTLEDFIKNYVRNKSLTESKEGYSAWLKKNGADSIGAISDGVSRADTTMKKASVTYGKNAEELDSGGLLRSGYASYINDAARKSYADSLSSLNEEYLKIEAKNLKGYEKYLENENRKHLEAYDAAVKSLEKSGIMDFEKAYGYALELGLNEKEARDAAEKTTASLIGETRKKVINDIILKRLGSAEAKQYALNLGLDEETANELAGIAYELYETVEGGYSESYLEYLKEQAKKNAQQ